MKRQSNQTLAAGWHYLGLALAVLLLLAYHAGQGLRWFILALLFWEAIGTWGHHWLRGRRES